MASGTDKLGVCCVLLLTHHLRFSHRYPRFSYPIVPTLLYQGDGLLQAGARSAGGVHGPHHHRGSKVSTLPSEAAF